MWTLWSILMWLSPKSRTNTLVCFCYVCVLRSICFSRKPYVKIVFHIFQCLIAQKKKNWLTENYFQSMKNPNKNKAFFFYRLFSKIFYFGKQSLSHGTLSYSFSLPFSFSFLTPLLSLTLVFCFAGKPFVKIVFHIFQCLIVPKKKKKMVNGKLSLVNEKS